MTYKTYVGEPEGEIIYIDKIKNKNKKLISFNSNLDPEDTKVGATEIPMFSSSISNQSCGNPYIFLKIKTFYYLSNNVSRAEDFFFLKKRIKLLVKLLVYWAVVLVPKTK